MATVGGFSRHHHLDELQEPLVTNEGVLSPAERRGRVIANIFGEGGPVEGVTFTGPLVVEGEATFEDNVVVEGALTINGDAVPAGTPVANVADVVTTGDWETDDAAVVAAINDLKDALVAYGIMLPAA